MQPINSPPIYNVKIDVRHVEEIKSLDAITRNKAFNAQSSDLYYPSDVATVAFCPVCRFEKEDEDPQWIKNAVRSSAHLKFPDNVDPVACSLVRQFENEDKVPQSIKNALCFRVGFPSGYFDDEAKKIVGATWSILMNDEDDSIVRFQTAEIKPLSNFHIRRLGRSRSRSPATPEGPEEDEKIH